MGSGELSSTMVETHKILLARSGRRPKAYFIDTPAGFQENVDLISQRAQEFFATRVGAPLEVASVKTATAPGAAKAAYALEKADYVLIGPGSPTYTVRQLKETKLPFLLSALVKKGGVLTMASAAALTIGHHTLPVYEIYKVGEDLHWTPGLDILGTLGLNLTVIPHFNNAEGGNHDTRYCYMGEKRFSALEKLLPPESVVLGLDEHTACLLDFSKREAAVRGLGKVTLRRAGKEVYFSSGATFSFDQFFDFCLEKAPKKEESEKSAEEAASLAGAVKIKEEGHFWARMHSLEEELYRALEEGDTDKLSSGLLQMDAFIWQAQLALENPEFISQGREIFRELLALISSDKKLKENLTPKALEKLIEELLYLRAQYRAEKNWPAADQIRQALQKAGFFIEDTLSGPKWHRIEE